MQPPALFDQSIDLLRYGLDGLSQRQEIIATNIANIDTPGYLTHEVLFEQQLQASLNNPNQADIPAMPDPITRNDLKVRNDGNNVDIDQQMTEMAKTTLQYQTATQLIAGKFSLLSAALAPIN